MEKLTDTSTIWFGKHKGKKLENVPADYLIWLFDNNKCPNSLRQYIIENRDVLDKEASEAKQQRKTDLR